VCTSSLDPRTLRDDVAAALVTQRTNGLCPLDGPCEDCDCFDSQHQQERADADVILAVIQPRLDSVENLEKRIEQAIEARIAVGRDRQDALDKLRWAEAELAAAKSREQAVRELHQSSGPNSQTYGRWAFCRHCSHGPGVGDESGSGFVSWPCPTIRTLVTHCT